MCVTTNNAELFFQCLPDSVLARIWIFFPKKELFNFFRELFAKESSYPFTAKNAR